MHRCISSKRTQIRGLRAAHLLLLSLAGLTATPTSAGSFQINPTLAEVPAPKSTASFHLRNSGGTPLTVQIEARRWTQPQGEYAYAPAEDLIIVPPLARIPPGGKQIVRIAHKNRPAEGEAAYRVLFREVPPAPEAGFVGVQTALKLDVPLFFSAEAPRHELVWRARRRGGRLHLTAENRGSRYARFTDLRVLDAKSRVIAETRALTYVLTRATRHWEFPAAGVQQGERLRLVVGSGSRQQELPLAFD